MPTSFEELKSRRDKKAKPSSPSSPSSPSNRPAPSSARPSTAPSSPSASVHAPKLRLDSTNGHDAPSTTPNRPTTQARPAPAKSEVDERLLSPSAKADLKAAAFAKPPSNVPVRRGGSVDSFAQFFPPWHARVSLLAARPSPSPDASALGRGIFAKRPIPPGTTVLSLPAHSAVLDTGNLQRRCSACFLEDADFSAGGEERDKGKQVRRCTRCFVVSYCSAACQKLDWPSHKPECEALNLFHVKVDQLEHQNQKAKASADDASREELARIPSSPVRALARLMWRKERENATWWENILDLESHYHQCGGPAKEKLMQLALALSRFVGASLIKDILGSAQELLDFCSKFTDNSFSLTSPSVDNIGVVISPPAALINHSCSPNAVVVFPEGGEGAGKRAGKEWVRIIAIRPIAPDEEVLTSYVDLAATGRERRAELRERYFFECRCPACLAEPTALEPDPRDMLKCPECTTWFQPPVSGDGGTQSRPASRPATPNPDGEYSFELRTDAGPSEGQAKPEATCPSCGFSRVMDIDGQRLAIKRSGVGQNGPGYLSIDPAKAAHYADRAIDWLQLKLSPFTCNGAFYPILDLRRLKFTAQLLSKKDRAQLLADAAQDIPKLLDGMQRVYGPGHPVTAVTKATVAKLFVEALYARRGYEIEDPDVIMPSLKTIRERYLDALEDLCVGLGPNGRVTRIAAEAVSMVEKDLAWWEKVAKDWDKEEVERQAS